MREDEKKRIEHMINTKTPKTKRTTIILEKEDRDFVDSLIREGKELGIKPLISKMLSVYKSMMIQDWRFPGEYYCGISRIAFVNVELINILFNQIPKEKWGLIGQEMGNALKISFETTLNIQTSQMENWELIFERLNIQGFGDFFLKDKYILLKTPFVNYPKIWKGILEGLLDVQLHVKTTLPPLVFQIKKRKLESADLLDS